MKTRTTKRLLAMLMAVVFTLGTSMAVLAAPAASPVYGVKLTGTSANYLQKSITVKYKDTGSPSAPKYRVAYRWRSNGKWVAWKYVTTTDTQRVFNDLSQSLYEFAVAPADSKGNRVGEYSNYSRRYIAAVSPAVTANSDGSITITAKKTAAVTGYRVSWSTNKNMSGAYTRNVTTSGNLWTKVKASLKKGKTYYVRVVPIYKLSGNTYLGIYNATRSVKVK